MSKASFDHVSEAIKARNLIFGTGTPQGTDNFSFSLHTRRHHLHRWCHLISNFYFAMISVSVNHSTEGVLLERQSCFLCNSDSDILGKFFLQKPFNVFQLWSTIFTSRTETFSAWRATCISSMALSYTSIMGSFQGLSVIALERYLAICFPIKHKKSANVR